MKRRFLTLGLICALTALAASQALARDTKLSSATDPQVHKGTEQRHESMNKRVAQGNVDLVFIGDSITQGWEGGGKEVWAKYYGKRNAVNLGIGGDRTQHVLWRLDNGNIDGIKPKLAVMMIGTNNSNGSDNTAEEIAAGIKAIVDEAARKAARDQGADPGDLPARRKAEDPQREERQGQRDRLEAGRQQERVLSRHRPQVPRQPTAR